MRKGFPALLLTDSTSYEEIWDKVEMEGAGVHGFWTELY